MQIKRFFATDTHTALRLVREAMGPEAIIIANRELEDGVEIIASGDYDESQIEAVSMETLASNNADYAAQATPQPQAIDDMRSEINQLRSLLESQLSTMQVASWGQQKDVRGEIYSHLTEQLGIGDALAGSLAQSCPQNTPANAVTEQALKALTEALQITQDPTLENGGIVVLHGPTGAGKTTTIAKLAAKFSQLHGSEGILMISADNRRIGAHEQLLALGKILAIPVLHARSNQELNAMLSALSEKKLVLVDSSGLVQSDLRQPDQLPGMQNTEASIRHYLVLPAIMQPHALDRILESMASLQLQGCIVSKVDEAISLGDLFTCLSKYQLPIAFWTDGQHIHEHLHPAKAVDLVAQSVLIARSKQVTAAEPVVVKASVSATESISLRH